MDKEQKEWLAKTCKRMIDETFFRASYGAPAGYINLVVMYNVLRSNQMTGVFNWLEENVFPNENREEWKERVHWDNVRLTPEFEKFLLDLGVDLELIKSGELPMPEHTDIFIRDVVRDGKEREQYILLSFTIDRFAVTLDGAGYNDATISELSPDELLEIARKLEKAALTKIKERDAKCSSDTHQTDDEKQ